MELIRHPVAEESDEEEEQEESEEHYEPKLPKRRAETAAEGSAKKVRTTPAGTQRRPDSKPHERARVSQIEAAGQGATITLPKSRFVLSSMTSLPFSDKRSLHLVIFAIIRPKVGAVKPPKRKALTSRPKASPATVPETPPAPTPTKSAATSTPPKAKDVVQVDSDHESHGGNFGDTGAMFGQDDVIIMETRKTAEAPADDAIVTMKDHQIPKLLDEQKWEVTHQSIDLLMKNIWEKPDDEYEAISAFQKKSNEFLEHQL